jgi:hypothetical protein
LFAAAALGVALVVVAPVPASAANVEFRAKLNGRDESTIDQNEPLRLYPDRLVRVDLSVTNRATEPVTVRSANLNGRVMGLTFFAFETRIDLVVPPGATETRSFGFELVGLKGQATGLLPAHLDLLDTHRHVIAGKGFPTRVVGSITSVYGIFGLLVAAITALLLAGALIRLATHRLPANRWQRGVRFGVPGIGLGLFLTFSLSAFNVLLPKPSSWLAIVLVCGAGLFVFGYITPTPVVYDEPDDYDDAEHPDYPSYAGQATS